MTHAHTHTHTHTQSMLFTALAIPFVAILYCNTHTHTRMYIYTHTHAHTHVHIYTVFPYSGTTSVVEESLLDELDDELELSHALSDTRDDDDVLLEIEEMINR